MEFLDGWRNYRHKRRILARPLNADIERRLCKVLGLLRDGIDAFCNAQPIAHLTTARMTRATFELAQEFLPASGRTQVEESLRTLFGDPTAEISLVLRAFAIAAVNVRFPRIPSTIAEQSPTQTNLGE